MCVYLFIYLYTQIIHTHTQCDTHYTLQAALNTPTQQQGWAGN